MARSRVSSYKGIGLAAKRTGLDALLSLKGVHQGNRQFNVITALIILTNVIVILVGHFLDFLSIFSSGIGLP